MRKPALQTVVVLMMSSFVTQLTAAEPARSDRPSAQEGIAAMNHEFEEAFATGDAATIADQYTKYAQSQMDLA